MKMISFWKDTTEIYNDDGFVLIVGHYDHKINSTVEIKNLVFIGVRILNLEGF